LLNNNHAFILQDPYNSFCFSMLYNKKNDVKNVIALYNIPKHYWQIKLKYCKEDVNIFIWIRVLITSNYGVGSNFNVNVLITTSTNINADKDRNFVANE